MMKHTVSVAAGLNLVVLDDDGRRVDALFVPFSQLLLVYLPAGLYALLRWAVFGLLGLAARLAAWPGRLSREVDQWLADLQFIGLAGWLLVRQRRFAEV